MPVVTAPTLDAIRAQFPGLSRGTILMDNAGGSQVPECVADAMRDFMLTNNVQVGGTYPQSARVTEIVAEAHDFVNTMFGGQGLGHAILGSSTSSLCRMLSDCYAEILGPEDEVIVAENGHEANVHPWTALAKRGIKVKVWEADPETGRCRPDTLPNLLTNKTRIVAFPHVSNILGVAEEVQSITKLAHNADARVVRASVAYAPHAAIDVAALGVDFCVFACYKVYGPHIGALWGSTEALSELTGRNHPFIAKDDMPTKFELGGISHEACAGILALKPYFSFLAGREDGQFDRQTFLDAFEVAGKLEHPLTERLLTYLGSKNSVRVIGPSDPGPGRFPTIAFLHDRLTPKEIVDHTDTRAIGMRNGNFYSWKLMERLGIPPTRGVARVSLVHYNSVQEVDRLIDALEEIL